MKQRIQFISKTAVLILMTMILQSNSGKSGGDVYRIFLNDKLLLEQFVTLPVKTKALSLDGANQNDHFIIHYSHCGLAGKERSIAMKNESGKVLKEWKFADTKATGMQLTVKKLSDASGKNGKTFIYYTSKEIPTGKLLTTLDATKKATANVSH